MREDRGAAVSKVETLRSRVEELVDSATVREETVRQREQQMREAFTVRHRLRGEKQQLEQRCSVSNAVDSCR
jgi:hypothetical protein